VRLAEKIAAQKKQHEEKETQRTQISSLRALREVFKDGRTKKIIFVSDEKNTHNSITFIDRT
jgi:hypothetical protein